VRAGACRTVRAARAYLRNKTKIWGLMALTKNRQKREEYEQSISSDGELGFDGLRAGVSE
jgi:hypothetical protein